jgi:SAM-dependent methyltransferase
VKNNIHLYKYKGDTYPIYLKEGRAYAYCEPFAEQFCKGKGLDIGGFDTWVFKDARPINITLNDGFTAHNLPEGPYDYIFSSHTLEHVDDYIGALEYWKTQLKPGGVLFLYLPHPDMKYWRPENNRKHRHLFHPDDLVSSLRELGYKDILASQRDLYWAFCVVAFA